MSDHSDKVKELQQAIIQRAKELAEEHVNQGKMTANRIIRDARDKVKLMEKKELLAAKDNAEREYQRRVQANELRMQAELDRNRWGLVQSVMDTVSQRVAKLAEDEMQYKPILQQLLQQGVELINASQLEARINFRDRQQYAEKWQELVGELTAKVELSDENCDCSGGVKLYSEDGDVMLDNSFEGIISRRQDELMRLVFERLFSQVQSIGVSHG